MKRTLLVLGLCVILGSMLGGGLARWGGGGAAGPGAGPVPATAPTPQPVSASPTPGEPASPASDGASEGGPSDAETAPPGRSSEAGEIDAAASANNAFAFDLYRRLAQGKGNLFFSPYSLSSALAMVYGGASGQTAAQLAQALHIELPTDTFHRAVSELARALEAPSDAYDLSVASALWGQKGYPFRSAFLDLMSRYYQVGLHEVDYTSDRTRDEARQAINAWVEEQTQGKIQNLIQPEDLSGLTRLVLTNAIYFKGAWELPFHPDGTGPMPFHLAAGATVDVPTMYQTGDFVYAENETVQVLELPYAGGKLSMVVVLPKDGGLQALEETIDPHQVQAWLAQGSKREVEVYLPKFTLKHRVVLNDVLRGLGVVDAFDPARADFSGMAEDPDLHLSQVIHQSFIEVNEEGTEAAAATGIGMRTTSLPANPPPVFRADRPFIFLIRDVSSGTILFMGRVADPRG